MSGQARAVATLVRSVPLLQRLDRFETGGQSKILAPTPFRRQPHERWWGTAHIDP